MDDLVDHYLAYIELKKGNQTIRFAHASDTG